MVVHVVFISYLLLACSPNVFYGYSLSFDKLFETVDEHNKKTEN